MAWLRYDTWQRGYATDEEMIEYLLAAYPHQADAINEGASIESIMASEVEKRGIHKVAGPTGFGDGYARNGWAAACALGKIGDTRALKPLVRIVSRAKPWSQLAAHAATALGNIGEPSALPALYKARETASRHVSSAAQQAIVQIQANGKSLEELSADLESDDKFVLYYAICRLAEIGGKRHLPRLQELLSDYRMVRTTTGRTPVSYSIHYVARQTIERLEEPDRNRDEDKKIPYLPTIEFWPTPEDRERIGLPRHWWESAP
ncbi:MAG: hypothetical protein DRI48_05355 [Chloroflexi bacterium]|nr:MAG: hypothetical protein DRI48_05355 [Chloroflexota bacterium]